MIDCMNVCGYPTLGCQLSWMIALAAIGITVGLIVRYLVDKYSKERNRK